MSIKSCILLICGMPGSGKSELSYKLKAKFDNRMVIDEQKPVSIYIISYDEIVSIIKSGGEQMRTYKEFRRDLLVGARLFICNVLQRQSPEGEAEANEPMNRSICESIMRCNEIKRDHHFIVVVDDNFYYHSMRFQWFQIAKQYQMGFAQIYIECQLELALIRNNQRITHQIVPDHVIFKMNQHFQSDSFKNSQFRTLTIQINTEINDDIKNLIIDAINDPIKSDDNQMKLIENQTKSRNITSSNLVHQVDCTLRDLISIRIKNDSDKDNNQNGKLLSKVKQSILSELKHDINIIPMHVQDYFLLKNSKYKNQAIQFLDGLIETKLKSRFFI